MIYLKLFVAFLEVGLFSFGGGYVSIPLIREIVLSYGWMDDEMITHMIAVSESTPGPLMVNMATYVGSSQGGILGALIATLAVVLPAFLIIVLVMAILRRFISNRYFQAILSGMKPCIIGIIMAMGIYLMVQNCFGSNFSGIDIMAVIMAILLGVVYWGSRKIRKNGISPILLIIISAGAGVFCYGFR
ncbi:chromate transporter [Butyrivibrio sp. AE2032]|uniref:chromate transporter n=1 Tax=Butyrivibrio sp. AE2032 TaxID=1458463 RepID=UPI000557A663|nr:chromate transporter [Butyrivibrio sp. AE2032]